MKWLIVLASLVMHEPVSAAGLCKPTGDNRKAECIAGWKGATDVVAYAGALNAMIDKLIMSIIYDSYTDQRRWFGFYCNRTKGDRDADPPQPPGGCQLDTPSVSSVSEPLANAFWSTLDKADKLELRLRELVHPTLDFITFFDPEKHDKISACNAEYYHTRIASYWNDFATAFRQDYDAYDDKYRKRIFKNYFQAIKRLYGFYANRMKRVMKTIKREYRCE